MEGFGPPPTGAALAGGGEETRVARTPGGHAAVSAPVQPASATADALDRSREGYVVLWAAGSSQEVQGVHWCDWGALEARLRIPAGGLAGHLVERGIQLRRVTSRAEAEARWRSSRLPPPMPEHPR